MKKRNAIIALIIAVLVIAGGGYMVVNGLGEEGTGAAQNIKLGLDLEGGVSITYQAVGDETPSDEDMSDTVYKLQKRVEGYSTEAQVYREGSDRINIEIPGEDNAEEVLERLGTPGSLYFIRHYSPDGVENYYPNGVKPNGKTNYDLYPDRTEEVMLADGSIVLSGSDVKSAQAGSIQNDMGNNEFVVDLVLTDEGSKKFAEATEACLGDTIMVYYDGDDVSTPVVQAVITGGSANITGMENFEEAEQLASTIRIGGLKVKLEELRSNVVGAQLGSEAISTSIKAGVIGFILVVIFMIAIYFIPGLAASLALSIYVVLMIVCLDLFDITLTLPGIAGIILSIGMAVDANVITFARIREELALGKSVQGAIQSGYKKALSAIIDGNVTTLIAAAVLGFLGTGSIVGFAQTLALGIVLSMFTALIVTKLLLRALFAVGFKDIKFYGKAKERKQVDFLNKKNAFIGISVAVILAGFVMMGVNAGAGKGALNFSLEFLGGTTTNVGFAENKSFEDIEANIIPEIEKITKDSNVQFQKVEGTNEVIFKTRTLTNEEREDFKAVMTGSFGVDSKSITQESITSTISSEMQRDAVVSVLIAVVLMLIYIWFRFKDMRFGASSVIALVHDVLVVLAFYAFMRISVGSTFIACMLTIVGYSINATIVIFDRVREKLATIKKGEGLDEMLNGCINQTLSRSVFTSLTTFIMVLVLYILGVSSIKEFALPLMAGIICGTYSSVCLACAIWYILKTKFVKKEAK